MGDKNKVTIVAALQDRENESNSFRGITEDHACTIFTPINQGRFCFIVP